MCRRRALQAAASLQQDRIATERGRARSDRQRAKARQKKRICPPPLAGAISRLPEPQSLSRNRRPKLSASRPKSVQPSGLFRLPAGLQRNKIVTERSRTRSDRQAHQHAPEGRICPRLLTQATSRSRTPTSQISASRSKSVQPWCVFAPIIQNFHVLSLEYLHFRAFEPATWHAV